jgi:hypothetical protein
MPGRSDPFTALSYGPVVGEPHQRIGAYDNVLTPRDIAVSPNMLDRYPLGSMVTATDARGVPLGTYRVGDTSYYSPGRPTSNTVEFRDADRSGNVFLNLADAPAVQVSAPDNAGVTFGQYGQLDLSNYPAVDVLPPGQAVPNIPMTLGEMFSQLANNERWYGGNFIGNDPNTGEPIYNPLGAIDRSRGAGLSPTAFGGIAGSSFGIGGYQGGIGGSGSVGFGFGASGMPSGGFGSIGPGNAFGGGGFRPFQL